MLRVILLAALTLGGSVSAIASDGGCGSFSAKAGETSLDLAPLGGFIEICGQDSKLCAFLTKGYPPSVTTLGYFVPPDEWKRFKSEGSGFTRYLIAQVGSMSPSELPGLKDYIRSNQGSIPDNTELPRFLEVRGQAPIPVFVDSADAVAFGVITKIRATVPTPLAEETLASTNAALVVKGKVLSLYVFVPMTGESDVEHVKTLTREWLNCLRAANKP